jgi:prepilin-type N-terminal cleavage/methylation domain-containing protein
VGAICQRRKLRSRNDVKAFTLAEVLITLGIIGVVASMTIPTLINKINDIEMITAWKKSYSTMEQSQRTIMNENGGDLAAGFTGINFTPAGGNNFRDGWSPYLKVIKKCDAGRAVVDGCYKGTMKALSDDYSITNYAADSNVSSLVLQDGTTLFFYPGVCTGTLCWDSNIFIDVNGSKMPNRLGKDIFDIVYNEAKKVFVANNYTSEGCSNEGSNCGRYYLSH